MGGSLIPSRWNGERFLARLSSEMEDQVVAEKGQKHGVHVACALAALARGYAQRNSHHRQHDAGQRQGKARVQLHLHIDPVRSVVVEQRARIHLPRNQGLLFRRFGVQRLVGDHHFAVVRLAVLAHLVGGAVVHRKLHAVVVGVRHSHGPAGHRHQRAVGLGAHPLPALVGRSHIRQEDIAPYRGRSGPHIAHIQNHVGEVFHEGARLDFAGHLPPRQLVGDIRGLAQAVGRHAQGSRAGQNGAQPGKQKYRRDHLAAGNARRAHGHNLAI